VAEPGSPPAAAAPERPAIANPLLAAFLAWIVPGAGHVMLRRTARGALFFVVVLASLAIGCSLQGNLYVPIAGQPLTFLATLGCMGLGLPYFALRYLLGYHGDIVAAGFEYGTAFILTAGLMNLLLVLDAWDIASGKKD
jgi:uncharacterized protein DUF6677